MRRITLRLAATVGLATVILPGARAATAPCQPSDAVRQALLALPDRHDVRLSFEQRVLGPLAELAERHPRDLFVHRALQRAVDDLYPQDLFAPRAPLAAGAPATLNLATLLERYRRMAEQRPDDPLALYLHGRLLVGKRNTEARRLLERALELDPEFAWPHLELLRMHHRPPFLDPAAAERHARRFIAACPESPAAYEYFSAVEDRALLSEGAERLRRLIDDWPDAPRLYRFSWDLAFRAQPIEEHDALRQIVAADVERLERSPAPGDRLEWLQTISYGRRLAGQEDPEGWLARELPNSEYAVTAAIREFEERNDPRLAPGAEVADLRPYWAEALAKTEEWVRRWPLSPAAWQKRLAAVQSKPELGEDAVREAALGFVRAAEAQRDRFGSFPPAAIVTAERLVALGKALDAVPELTRRTLAQLEADAAAGAVWDLDELPPTPDRPELTPAALRAQVQRRALQTETAALIELGRLDEARQSLDKLEALTVDDSRGGPSFRERSRSLELRGALAVAEHLPADALAYYAEAWKSAPRALRRKNSALYHRLDRLWKQIGGTDQGLELWLTSPEPQSQAARPRREPVELPPFDLEDLAGRRWRLGDFAGKALLINVWSMSCGPCREQHQQLEKLRQSLAERADIVVLTFNIDENPGFIQPYLEEEGFDFSVLLARIYFEQLRRPPIVPQNWIVDSEGRLLNDSARIEDVERVTAELERAAR